MCDKSLFAIREWRLNDWIHFRIQDICQERRDFSLTLSLSPLLKLLLRCWSWDGNRILSGNDTHLRTDMLESMSNESCFLKRLMKANIVTRKKTVLKANTLFWDWLDDDVAMISLHNWMHCKTRVDSNWKLLQAPPQGSVFPSAVKRVYFMQETWEILF